MPRELLGDVEIDGVVHHTGKVLAGALFCCVPGSRFDGHDLAEQVVSAGAAALLVERRLPLDVPQILVPSVRFAMGPLAARFWGDPSRSITVIGPRGGTFEVDLAGSSKAIDLMQECQKEQN